jgi:two-component system, cell cycle response regulator DivK
MRTRKQVKTRQSPSNSFDWFPARLLIEFELGGDVEQEEPMTSVTKRVLLVEDFEDSRFSLSKLLEIEGYEVLEAGDGAEAVNLALSAKPDLILMDLSLPIIDGLSATKKIREHESQSHDAVYPVPIIALSAHDLSDFHTRARDAGCTDYVTKPIDFDALMVVMSKYLPV